MAIVMMVVTVVMVKVAMMVRVVMLMKVVVLMMAVMSIKRTKLSDVKKPLALCFIIISLFWSYFYIIESSKNTLTSHC